jgi:hypothetical protein
MIGVPPRDIVMHPKVQFAFICGDKCLVDFHVLVFYAAAAGHLGGVSPIASCLVEVPILVSRIECTRIPCTISMFTYDRFSCSI